MRQTYIAADAVFSMDNRGAFPKFVQIAENRFGVLGIPTTAAATLRRSAPEPATATRTSTC